MTGSRVEILFAAPAFLHDQGLALAGCPLGQSATPTGRCCQTKPTWISSSAIPLGVAVQTCPGTIGIALVKVPVLTISPAAERRIERIVRRY